MRTHCYDGLVPRDADVEQQRTWIAEAVGRLIARGGLEAVSLRNTAREADVSMGRVQHYFSTKDELLLDALQRSYRSMETRVAARVDASAGEARGVLVAILEEILGEHPETRDAIRINMAFAARALDDPRVAAILTEGDGEIIALAEQVIMTHRADVDPPIDPQQEARVLFAMASGLGSSVALYGMPVTDARRTLHYHLNRVAPARPGR